MTRKVLITAALPYVNNVPHLGNLIGSTLSADVFARYCRSRGYDVLYVCGTDEHGTATEVKAREEGVTPRALCDKYFAIHKTIYEWFGIQFDVFGRTSDPAHVAVTQEIFTRLDARGFITSQDVEQLYSERDGMFLADRYVLGTCPKCGYPDARGDQCERCGALLTPTELIEPRSALSGDTPLLKTSTHLFIDLPALQPALAEWFAERHFSENTTRTTDAWLARGLEPRAITRDLTWGVPVPKPGYEKKVFYVWFDAPIGYISMTGSASTPLSLDSHAVDGLREGHEQVIDQRERAIEYWWRDDHTELYQFIGKDNIPFHSVLFPAMLLGTGDEWVTVKHINTTEFLNFEGEKFSKSRGTGLFGDQAMSLGIPADVFRYYLLINRPEQADTNFSWNDFHAKLSGELVANLGNLVNRTLSFINQFCSGTIPAYARRDVDTAFRAELLNGAKQVEHELASVKLKDALKNVMRLSTIANGFFQRHEPWRTRSDAPAECSATIATLANTLVDLAIMIEPFMPRTAHAIAEQLATPLPRWSAIGSEHVTAGHRINENKPLFRKLEEDELRSLRVRFSNEDPVTQAAPKGSRAQACAPSNSASNDSALIENDAFLATELIVGTIIAVTKHPDAERLFVETIDLGLARGSRTIVSGLAGHYAPDDLLGKTVVVVANLKPAKLRGVTSHGMLLAAENEAGVVGVVTTDAPPGTVLAFADENARTPRRASRPDEPLPLITIDTFARLALEMRVDGLFCDGKKLTAAGRALHADKNVTGRVR
jgi:methionyl-tRNA synthetase